MVDDNDILILSNGGNENEYIRLEKSKNFQIVEFRDCKLQPIDNNQDDVQIIFSDFEPFPFKKKQKNVN